MVRKGFTLIELLVVIAIIAILAAILFPVFERVKAKAQQAACMNNLKQIATAILMYAHDWDTTLPLYSEDTGTWHNPAQPAVDNGFPAWGGHTGWLWTYLQSEEVFVCPTNSSGFGGAYGYLANGYSAGTGIDGRLHDWTGGQYQATCYNSFGSFYPGKTLDYFNYPTHFLTFIDGSGSGTSPSCETQFRWEKRGSTYYYITDQAFNWNTTCATWADPPWFGKSGARQIFAWHTGKANAAFLDGHVSSIDLAVLSSKWKYYCDAYGKASGDGQFTP